MTKKYMKLTLLNEFYTVGGNKGKVGKVKYPQIMNETILGSTILKLSTGMAYMFKDDVIDNVWILPRTFLVPSGMAFTFEVGYSRKWYGRYFKVTK